MLTLARIAYFRRREAMLATSGLGTNKQIESPSRQVVAVSQ
jgi:hypothetical protein